MTRSLLALPFAVGLAITVSGCSNGGTPTPPSTSLSTFTLPSKSPSAADTSVAPTTGSTDTGNANAPKIDVPITDAVATRDALIEAAKASAEAQGFPTGWSAYQPGITFAGSLVPADPTHVSGFNFVFSKSKDASYLAFAVADSNGTCAGGLLLDDNKSYTRIVSGNAVTIPAGQKCIGQVVADIAGYLT